MRVDVKIAFGFDVKIDQTMTRHLIQHVIEKRQAGLKDGFAGPLQIDANGDLGFQRITYDFGTAIHTFSGYFNFE